MLSKYNIEFAVPLHGNEQTQHHLTDDPVACEEFLSALLERGLKIKGVTHQGVALPPVECDRMVKTAAGMLATRHLCRSLDIDTVEAHHRFGTTA